MMLQHKKGLAGITLFLGCWLALVAQPAWALEKPAVHSKQAGRPLHVLKLSIAPQYMEKLQAKQQDAVKKGFLISSDDDFVPARITIDQGEPIKVKVRIKGDMTDHFGNNWSFRVKVKKGHKIFGMSKFSIQGIATRLGHWEALYLRHLNAAGLLSPQYFFVDYYLNGKKIGPMAVEEHFTKELLERQGRRESVILAFDEDVKWMQAIANIKIKNDYPEKGVIYDYPSIWLYPFRCFQSGKAWKNPYLRIYYEQALGMLRGYKFLDIYNDQIFDARLLARYLVIAHLWGVAHGLSWHNIRVYYNPITRLFEPIAFDNEVRISGQRLYPIFFFLFTSKAFADAYVDEANKLKAQIDSGELQQMLQGWEAEYAQQLGLKPKALYPYARFKDAIDGIVASPPVHKTSRVLRGYPKLSYPVIKPEDRGKIYYISKLMFAYYIEQGDTAYVELMNITDRPLKIDEMYIRSKSLGMNMPVGLQRDTVPPFMLTKESLTRIPVPKIDRKKDEIHIIVTYNKYNAREDDVAEPYFAPATKAKYQPLSNEALLAAFPFVEEQDPQTFRVKPGVHTVNQTLVVPTGRTLVVGAGTTLTFAANTRLVVRGALRLEGKQDQPVKLAAKKQGKGWGGIVVLQAGAPSEWRYVVVSDVRKLQSDDWGLPGAVTVYESPLTAQHCQFVRNRTEDGINLVHSTFALTDCRFEDTQSDAIDVDFGNGAIEKCSFARIGGDAIDVSGTKATVRNVTVEKVADKGISVGEKSDLACQGITVKGASIGIASKDGSVATLSDSSFSDISTAAFAAYIKKPEYEAARLSVSNTTLEKCRHAVLCVEPCRMTIDGKEQKAGQYDVKKLYQP